MAATGKKRAKQAKQGNKEKQGKQTKHGNKGKPSWRPQPSFPGQDASNRELEAIVFGQALDLHDDGAAAKVDEEQLASAIEGSVPKVTTRRNKRKRSSGTAGVVNKAGESKAAWIDDDDAKLQVDLTKQSRTMKLRKTDAEVKVAGKEYEKRLREQFVKIHGTASWAEPRPEAADAGASSDDEQDASDLLATSAKPTAPIGTGALLPEQIDIIQRRPVTIAEPGADQKPAVMQALQFHPDSELMLAAGLDKTLRIFSIDGEENPRISKHFYKQFPITAASFTSDGDQVLLTGLHGGAMWSLDVGTGVSASIKPQPTQLHRRLFGLTVGPHPSDAPGLRTPRMFTVLGDAGAILVCDTPSKQPIRTLRMSMPGVAAVFSKDSDVLWSADQDNNLYEWDLGTGRCKQRCKATWATGISSLALHSASPRASTPQLAVGTSSGNIDVYDLSGPALPKEPSLSFNNMVTRISGLCFHPAGELLVGFSRLKPAQMKLMHCATRTVYENWPTRKTDLHTVAAVALSRQKGWFAFANERGRVHLYQLRHYA